jgi:hypothetical protein
MKLTLALGMIIILTAFIWLGLELKDIFAPPTYPCTECLRKDKIIYKLTIDSTHKNCLTIK